MATQDEVMAELRQVFDPEIPVNIIDLGLVYDVQVLDTGVCQSPARKRARSPKR